MSPPAIPSFAPHQASPASWIEAVIADFNAFLLDHASAERKAAATAVSFVVQYPDRYALHSPMIRLAREELRHYQQVMELVHERKLVWKRDVKDPYVGALVKRMAPAGEARLLDRLLMGSVIEARGVERFGLVGEAVDDPKLKRFYQRISQSEAKHTRLFADLASNFFDSDTIEARLECWWAWEVEAMLAVPPRAALH